MVKILIVAQTSELGGAERCIVDLAHAVRISRPAWSVAVLAPGTGPLARSLACFGVDCVELPWPRGLDAIGDGSFQWREQSGATLQRLLTAGLTTPALARYTWQLRKMVARISPTIVHTHGIKAHLMGTVARVPSALLVWHNHDYLGKRGVSRWLMQACSRDADAIVANSKDVARDVSRALKRPAHAILNGIDTLRFNPHVAPADDVLAVGGPKTLRVGLVATYARWKGHRLFLEAARAVVRAQPNRDVRFFVVGGGIYRTPNSQVSRSELEAAVRELDLERHVSFFDFRADIERVYRALDLVVHASTEPEPFGLVVAEAMACGRPVITAGQGGVLELVSPDVSGLVVQPNDSKALASGLVELLDDPVRRARLGQGARSNVERHLCRDRYGQEVIDLYERLLESRKLPNPRRAA